MNILWKCSFLVAMLFLVQCGDQESNGDIPVENAYKASTLDLKKSQVQLERSALEKSLNWGEYQTFVTSLENFDHSKSSAEQLYVNITELVDNPDEAFIDLPIISRAKLLQTRIGVLSSYLGYTVKTAEKHEQKFNDVVIAFDELKTQMNKKFNEIDNSKQQLLEQLRNERRNDEAQRKKDSLAASL